MKHSANELNETKKFLVEFYGYNFTVSGIVKKVYIKAPFAKKESTDQDVDLGNNKLELIASALNNQHLSSFESARYSLYDISFREDGFTNSIGFSFIDTQDSAYIETQRVFRPFMGFGANAICDVVDKIKSAMFPQRPNYNPIFMIGLVMSEANLACVKAYVRYDLDEVPTPVERGKMIEQIVCTINPKTMNAKWFSAISEKLENLGFVFSFVGADNYDNGSVRFKLYFRYYGKNDLKEVAAEVTCLLSRWGLFSDIPSIFRQHHSGIWGLAISTKNFECVNGVQLYFYP